MFCACRLTTVWLLLASAGALRADLTFEQQSTKNDRTQSFTIKLHGDKMRVDEPNRGISVIVDLKTRDSYTLVTTNKVFVEKFGSEIRWEMEEERKHTNGTNEMDAAPALAVDTGKVEEINGRPAKIYAWKGAYDLTETLWVDTNYPHWDVIREELAKLDAFNETGPHRNVQPQFTRLPGMIVKSTNVAKGQTVTSVLISANVDAVSESEFVLPPGYKEWKQQQSPP